VDERLRELDRRWRAQGDDGALDALLEAYRRAGRPLPLELVRASPRWRRLTGFVRKWYARPLGDGDGNTLEEIAAAEARLGTTLPIAVREWYRLVGCRVRQVQDAPVGLKKLPSLRDEDDGMIVLYVENQSVVRWGFRAADAIEIDPPGYVSDAGDSTRWSRQHDSVSELLLTLVLSETLIGAWAGRGLGSLGPLGEEVRGTQGSGPKAAEALRRAYRPLPFRRGTGPATRRASSATGTRSSATSKGPRASGSRRRPARARRGRGSTPSLARAGDWTPVA
jgi:hypothetical protein